MQLTPPGLRGSVRTRGRCSDDRRIPRAAADDDAADENGEASNRPRADSSSILWWLRIGVEVVVVVRGLGCVRVDGFVDCGVASGVWCLVSGIAKRAVVVEAVVGRVDCLRVNVRRRSFFPFFWLACVCPSLFLSRAYKSIHSVAFFVFPILMHRTAKCVKTPSSSLAYLISLNIARPLSTHHRACAI